MINLRGLGWVGSLVKGLKGEGVLMSRRREMFRILKL